MLRRRRIESSRCTWQSATHDRRALTGSTNPNKINPISGKPIGYKLVPTPSQLMLAHPDSVGHAVSHPRSRTFGTSG
jgi:primary-amine oxidase